MDFQRIHSGSSLTIWSNKTTPKHMILKSAIQVTIHIERAVLTRNIARVLEV